MSKPLVPPPAPIPPDALLALYMLAIQNLPAAKPHASQLNPIKVMEVQVKSRPAAVVVKPSGEIRGRRDQSANKNCAVPTIEVAELDEVELPETPHESLKLQSLSSSTTSSANPSPKSQAPMASSAAPSPTPSPSSQIRISPKAAPFMLDPPSLSSEQISAHLTTGTQMLREIIAKKEGRERVKTTNWFIMQVEEQGVGMQYPELSEYDRSLLSIFRSLKDEVVAAECLGLTLSEYLIWH